MFMLRNSFQPKNFMKFLFKLKRGILEVCICLEFTSHMYRKSYFIDFCKLFDLSWRPSRHSFHLCLTVKTHNWLRWPFLSFMRVQTKDNKLLLAGKRSLLKECIEQTELKWKIPLDYENFSSSQYYSTILCTCGVVIKPWQSRP